MSGKTIFFLCCQEVESVKVSNFVQSQSYTIHFIPDSSIYGYTQKFRGDKRCSYDNIDSLRRCSAISGEWHSYKLITLWDDNNTVKNDAVLFGYSLRQIPVITYPPADISHWNPLFTIYDEDYHQQRYVIKITKQEDPPWDVSIYCEVLTILNVLPNGELYSYYLSLYTLDYYSRYDSNSENNRVRISLQSSKLYSTDNREGIDICLEDNCKRGKTNDIDFSRKVYDYYLTHKSGINTEENPKRIYPLPPVMK